LEPDEIQRYGLEGGEGGAGQDRMSLVILGVKVVVREMQVLALEVFRTGPRRDSMSLRMRMRMSCPVDDFPHGLSDRVKLQPAPKIDPYKVVNKDVRAKPVL
jgi:hypothetical protein